MSRVFEIDQLTGSVQHFHFDESGSDDRKGRFVIEDVQIVDSILEQNTALRNSGVRASRKSLGRRVASIPMNIYMELAAKGITKDPKRMAKWLDDPDNRAWRTDNTRIGNHNR